VGISLVLAAALLLSGSLTPARFPERPAWHVGHGRVHACPGMARSECETVSSWAATVPWRDCAECLPHKTVESLPPSGIAIQVSFGRGKSPSWVKPMSWPPRLRPITAGFEGLPGRIGVVQLIGRVHGYETAVWVFFGRPRPTRLQIARARAELATARLPNR
jgi:hypothetical protein